MADQECPRHRDMPLGFNDVCWKCEQEQRDELRPAMHRIAKQPTPDDLQRRIYATAALTGLLQLDDIAEYPHGVIAEDCFRYADAMLLEQKKREAQ